MNQFGNPSRDPRRLLVRRYLGLAGCGLGDGPFLSPEGCTNKEKVDAVLHVDPCDER